MIVFKEDLMEQKEISCKRKSKIKETVKQCLCFWFFQKPDIWVDCVLFKSSYYYQHILTLLFCSLWTKIFGFCVWDFIFFFLWGGWGRERERGSNLEVWLVQRHTTKGETQQDAARVGGWGRKMTCCAVQLDYSFHFFQSRNNYAFMSSFDVIFYSNSLMVTLESSSI